MVVRKRTLRTLTARGGVRRAAAGGLALLILAFALYSYVDSRDAKKALGKAGTDLQKTREGIERTEAANRTLTDEVRHLQDVLRAAGAEVPQFTFPTVQGPPGPPGPPGRTSPTSTPSTSTTTTTTRPPTTTSTSTTSTTTPRPPPSITLPTLPFLGGPTNGKTQGNARPG